jgi:hypothetical protein
VRTNDRQLITAEQVVRCLNGNTTLAELEIAYRELGRWYRSGEKGFSRAKGDAVGMLIDKYGWEEQMAGAAMRWRDGGPNSGIPYPF